MTQQKPYRFLVLVAALGYFVDVYDLILFSVVRQSSLRGLAVPEADLLPTGVYLLNVQMAGFLIGGVMWGILGDKRGRLSVLFGSIILYSVANIANGFVSSVDGYALCRLLAGIGLAGELGAGITLVAETMPKEIRGYGTTIVATVGVAGAVVAGLVAEKFDWRTSYFVGGALGLMLLALRVAVCESGLFENLAARKDIVRGDFRLLLSNPKRFLRYLRCILVGVPIWYGVGIIITFCPELGAELKIQEIPKAGLAVLWCYVGLVAGDLSSGLVSQALRSRRKAIGLFIVISAICSAMILFSSGISLQSFYALCILLGFGLGYWAVFNTSAAEQFGTNLRATVATTAPNFVRASTIPMATLFDYLKGSQGVVNSALIVGAIAFALAFWALVSLEETFSKDLDFIES